VTGRVGVQPVLLIDSAPVEACHPRSPVTLSGLVEYPQEEGNVGCGQSDCRPTETYIAIMSQRLGGSCH
jgi:hypothetical protein